MNIWWTGSIVPGLIQGLPVPYLRPVPHIKPEIRVDPVFLVNPYQLLDGQSGS